MTSRKKSVLNLGNEILFASLLVLAFAPRDYKLPGLAILCCCLVLAAVIDWEKNTKRVRRFTKRVAACSCVKAKEKISHMNVAQLNCTICGAEAS